MLVLTRKREEEIVIGGEIRVKVIAIEGNRVQLGISAPSEIPIHRDEIARRIRDEPAAFGNISNGERAVRGHLVG